MVHTAATLRQKQDRICGLSEGCGFNVAHLVSPTQIRIRFQPVGHVVWLAVFKRSSETTF